MVHWKMWGVRRLETKQSVCGYLGVEMKILGAWKLSSN
jgi:hypothetical protein